MVKGDKIKEPDGASSSSHQSHSLAKKFGRVMSMQGKFLRGSDLSLMSLNPSVAGSTMSMMSFLQDPQVEELDSEVLIKSSALRRAARARPVPLSRTLHQQESELKRMKMEQDRQLASICRQMMILECGLKKKEKELAKALDQRDRIIREQTYIIKFLLGKTGTKTRNIQKLKDEALAKIPQMATLPDHSPTMEVIATSSPLHLTTIRVNAGPPTLPRRTSSICSTVQSLSPSKEEKNNDSDSAIILDESLNHTISSSSDSLSLSRRLSRSISDVMNVGRELNGKSSSSHLDSFLLEDDEASDSLGSKPSSSSSDCECSYSVLGEDTHISHHGYYNEFDFSQYRGFLLRNGSYERYKIKSRLQKEMVDREIDRKNLSDHHSGASWADKESEKRSLHDDPEDPNLSELNNNSHNIINNISSISITSSSGANSLSSPASSSCSSNHRHVTKPRDVKNRNTRKVATHSPWSHSREKEETLADTD